MTEQDKLKKLIKNEVFIAIQRAFPSCIDEECVKPGIADKHDAATEATDSILSLLAPELEKARLFILNKDYIDRFYSEAEELRTNAEKWRKVSSLVEGDCNSCKSLRYCEKNDIHPCEILKDALEGEGEKG